MIRASGIVKTYGHGSSEFQALRGVDLHIKPNEVVAIMGPSGSGKTTLLQTMSGIDKIDEGEIWINGHPLHTFKDDEMSKFRLKNMGFIFQAYHLVPVLTAMENVEIPLIASGVNKKEAEIRARQALKDVELSGMEQRYPSELSGGQNQRVSIARAIVSRPQIIWADELTGALDTETAEKVMDLLLEINRSTNVTIVIVTHDRSIAKRAKRILYMEDGRILKEGN